jgi:predicted PurR-regulated permease PerM
MTSTKETRNAFFRQLIFIGVLISIALIIWGQLSYMLSGFLGAVTLYIVLRPILRKLTKKYRWRPWQAATLLIVLTVIVLLLIVGVVVTVVISEIPAIDTSGLVSFFNEGVQEINNFVGKEIISKDIIIKYQDTLMGILSGFLNTTYGVILNLMMMLLILYFMFVKSEKMEETFVEYVPFKGESLEMIKQELKNMIFGNAVGIPLIMLVQALFASLGYWIFGVKDVGFWGFMTSLVGLIPIVGTTGVWLPLGIYLIASGNIWQGIGLIIYGGIVISSADNVCRFVLMQKTADVHPLITIFGVIMGIPLFGFWGIIFGPLLISGFMLLMKIYHKEYSEKKPLILHADDRHKMN